MPKVKETRLRKGDTIKCADAEDCVRTMNELAVCGIETDFLYEKDGESGLWLEITGGKIRWMRRKIREAIEKKYAKIRDAYNATLRSLPRKTRERSDYNNYVDAFIVAIEALEKADIEENRFAFRNYTVKN